MNKWQNVIAAGLGFLAAIASALLGGCAGKLAADALQAELVVSTPSSWSSSNPQELPAE